jgi:rRNA maturation endonuclease Nob1
MQGELTFVTSVAVLDTGAIIELKKAVPRTEQWDLFDAMLRLVRAGMIAFPSQVVKEMAHGEHPDAPGVWTAKAGREVAYRDPEESTLAYVLRAVRDPLTDVDASPELEPADPYVAAMAYELHEAHPDSDVFVATEDCVDRLPVKLALSTACLRLGIRCCSTAELVKWIGEN